MTRDTPFQKASYACVYPLQSLVHPKKELRSFLQRPCKGFANSMDPLTPTLSEAVLERSMTLFLPSNKQCCAVLRGDRNGYHRGR